MWETGGVEDVLLGVERGELPARLVQVIDDTARGAAHAGVEAAEQARRAGADYGDIFEVLHGANVMKYQRRGEWGVVPGGRGLEDLHQDGGRRGDGAVRRGPRPPGRPGGGRVRRGGPVERRARPT